MSLTHLPSAAGMGRSSSHPYPPSGTHFAARSHYSHIASPSLHSTTPRSLTPCLPIPPAHSPLSLGMTIALVGLGCAFLLLPASSPSAVLNAAAPAPDTTSTGASALAISSVCVFVAFFSIGLGPINWLLTSEIFPLRLRAQAIGIGTAVNRVASGAVAMSFLSLADATGRAGPFFIFAVMGVLAFFFFLFFAPETKGRTLEQIVKMFDRRTYAWHPEEEEVPSVGLAVFDGNRMQQGWGTGESSPKRGYRSTLSP